MSIVEGQHVRVMLPANRQLAGTVPRACVMEFSDQYAQARACASWALLAGSSLITAK